jgi:hypothetical protein
MATVDPHPGQIKPVSPLSGPYGHWEAITPHDTNQLARIPSALLVSAGTLAIVDIDGNALSLTVAAGGSCACYPLRPVIVKSTGTTATVHALW